MWKRILLFSSVHVVIIINIDDVVIVVVLVAMEIPPIHKRFIVMKYIKVDQQTDFRRSMRISELFRTCDMPPI